MANLFEVMAEPCPDSTDKHLPAGLLRCDVYEMVIHDLGFKEKKGAVSLHWFRQIWRRIPNGQDSEKAKGGQVLNLWFEIELKNKTLDFPRRFQQAERKAHYREIRQDRSVYQQRKIQAQSGDIMLIAQDGMDQVCRSVI